MEDRIQQFYVEVKKNFRVQLCKGYWLVTSKEQVGDVT